MCIRIRLALFSEYLSQMASFSVLSLWHTYADSHQNRSSKKGTLVAINNVNFQEEGHVYYNCIFHILAVQRRSLFSSFYFAVYVWAFPSKQTLKIYA